MSGLTAAAYLAQAGHSVTVYEQFPTPGGVTATVWQAGFGWDIGPLLLEGFNPGDRGRKVLEELGISEQVPIQTADRGLVLNDIAFWKPAEYQGPYWRRDLLKARFPSEANALDRYYQFYDQMVNLASLGRQLESANGFSAIKLKLQMLWAFQQVRHLQNWNAQQLMDHYFRTPEIKTILTGIVADFVTKTSEFPALGVPFIHQETAFDERIPTTPGTSGAHNGWGYIQGGCGTLVQALLNALTGAGGQVITGSTVNKIHIKNGAVEGIEVDGRLEAVDLVVASGGAKDLFFELVGKEYLTDSFINDLEKIRFMESVFMVHLGVDLDPRPYQPAALCYYYLTNDLEGNIDRLREGFFHGGDEGFLIYVPSLPSPELAPAGQYAITIYTIAPDQLSNGSWDDLRETLAEQLVEKAERYIPGLRAHTLTRLVMTPADFRQRTHQRHHSFGGIPPVIGNPRPPHRTPIHRLWFVGGESASGGGVQNVTLGAAHTVRLILKGLK